MKITRIFLVSCLIKKAGSRAGSFNYLKSILTSSSVKQNRRIILSANVVVNIHL